MNIDELPAGTLILEPQSYLNKAIIGFETVLIYDYELLIDSFMEMFREETQSLDAAYHMSREWIDFNILCSSEIMDNIIIKFENMR